jgi:hypothetical protein
LSKKKNKKIKLRYEEFGEILNSEVAFIQAGVLLDLAAFAALESGDPKKIREVSREWSTLAVSLKRTLEGEPEDVTSEHEHHTEDVTRVKVMGFGSTKMREQAEREHKS